MAADLDTLIDEARVEAYSASPPPLRGVNRRDVRPAKDVLPEPGEPELIGQPMKQHMGLFRRRQEQRFAATQRRLSFARALVSTGWNEAKALEAAGYKPNQKHKDQALQALRNHPEVIAEIQRLRLVLEQQADVATIDLAREWVSIAKSNVFDAFKQDEDGSLQLKHKADIPVPVQRTIKSVKIRRWRQIQKDESVVETENIEVTLWDKQAALDSLAKIQGLYSDKTAEAIDGLAMKIAQRTERYRKKIGHTYDQNDGN